ncbi:MAG: helix-turn-helix transcriptional regulator [Ruminococcaceae bacterium]|nr:helix-turn-helix transcriptional regulator [Oscillospiraceae bacterium]
MSDSQYERHHYKEPLLPFLCHRDILRRPHAMSIHFHWHEHLEFLRGISGTAYIGAHHSVLNEGTVVTVNTGEPHNGYTDTEAVYDCLIVNISFCRENGIDPDSLYFSPCTDDPEAARLHKEACEAFRTEGSMRVIRTRHAVLSFLLYLCEKHSRLREAYTDSSSDAVKEALRYIRNHFSEQISLDDAASAAGLSKYYFAHRFKQITGQSFVSYLNSIRCDKAVSLLKEGTSVAQVCFECGFCDPAYFSRIFKKIVGVSPSSIKKS